VTRSCRQLPHPQTNDGPRLHIRLFPGFESAILVSQDFSHLKRLCKKNLTLRLRRLDAIGAVGIARCFAYSGKRNRGMYETGDAPSAEGVPGPETARDHFSEKLLRLSSMMKTEAGRAEALQRQSLLEDFVREFDRECGLAEGNTEGAKEGRAE
jgi:hypothetical protein